MQTGKLPIQTLSVLLLMAWSLQAQSTPAVGRTAGELAVSATGAATYSVPLTLPPGIGEVVPSLALTYNSQAGDGIAGWGWSLAGLSSIARVGATLHHDGFIDPVDLDDNDRFALDGQRLLLKTGTYGQAGSTYQTENFNNILVVAKGQTHPKGSAVPQEFVVHYPDGSQAGYRLSHPKVISDVEWTITYWIDPQGNRIDYYYGQDAISVPMIETIKYGGQDRESHPNSINFEYEDRKQQHENYIGGYLYKRTQKLISITIVTNNEDFRTYKMFYDSSSQNTDRLISIQEFSQGKAKPKVVFGYQNENYTEQKTLGQTLADDATRFDVEKDNILTGDFNGDGHLDYAVQANRQSGACSLVLTQPQKEGQLVFAPPIPFGNQAVVSDKLDHTYQFVLGSAQTPSNALLSQNTVVQITESTYRETPLYYTENSPRTSIEFTNYQLVDSKTQVLWTKTWNENVPVHTYTICGTESNGPLQKKYLSGDFNGDGILDLLLYVLPYRPLHCNNVCQCSEALTEEPAQLYWIDLNRNSQTFVFRLPELEQQISRADRLIVLDHNGDGKTDILHFKDNAVSVYSMQSDLGLETLASQVKLIGLDLNRPLFFGDFNGDGKQDFVHPLGINVDQWRLFVGTGKGFLSKTTLGLPYFRVASSDKRHQYFYTPQDVDSDGKTELLYHDLDYGTKIQNPALIDDPQSTLEPLNVALQRTSKLYVYQYQPEEKGFAEERNLNIDFSDHRNGIEKAFPLPVPYHQHFLQQQYGFLVGDHLFQKPFMGKHSHELLLKTIEHRGFSQQLQYTFLGADEVTYTASENQYYPYVNINTALSLPLVSRVIRTGSGLQGIQEFKYYGAVSHLRGLGFLGFQGVARTNVYGSGVSRQWSVSRHAPDQRGAITQSWQQSQHSFTPPTADYISRTDYDYYTQSLANKVYINSPASIRTRDGLTGFETVQSFTYDAYQNPTRILTEKKRNYTIPHRKGPGEGRSEPDQPDWWQEQTLTYSHRPEARNKYYHIGRLKQEETTTSWDGNQLTTTVAYPDYANNLLEKQTTTNNTGQTLTETFAYDGYGNLIEKSLSAADLADRTESYSYTDDGRFLVRHTDVSGLESHFTYHPEGSLHTETDPLGRTTTYSYDAWQRLTQSTDYLGNSSHIRYSWLNTNHMVQHREGADGSESETHYDVWGQSIATHQKDISGKWQRRTTEYRVSGAVYRQSEPFFQGSKVYTTYTYDSYGRPTRQSCPAASK